MKGRLEKGVILIVDDIEEYLYSLKNALGREFDVLTAVSMNEAKKVMNEKVELLLLDIRLDEDNPQNKDGIVLLEWCKENCPSKPVVMMSAYQDFDMAVDALNLGASYFLRKPINISELRALLGSLIEQVRLSKEDIEPGSMLSEYENED